MEIYIWFIGILLILAYFLFDIPLLIQGLILLSAGLYIRQKKMLFNIKINHHLDSSELYPIDSNELWGISIHNDSCFNIQNGVYRYIYSKSESHTNPSYIFWHGLNAYNDIIQTNSTDSKIIFKHQVKWAVSNAFLKKTHLEWQYNWHFASNSGDYPPPWISSMSQGLGISLLLRAWRFYDDPDYLEVAKKAAQIYFMPIDAGGILLNIRDCPFFEEYPNNTPTLILDGGLFALIALFELAIWTNDRTCLNHAINGAKCIRQNADIWNYHKIWSWYGKSGNLSDAKYHKLNTLLLHSIGLFANDDELLLLSGKWSRIFKFPYLFPVIAFLTLIYDSINSFRNRVLKQKIRHLTF